MFFCLASVEIDGRRLLVHSCEANISSFMQVLMNVLVKGFAGADDLIAALFFGDLHESRRRDPEKQSKFGLSSVVGAIHGSSSEIFAG